MRGWGRGGREGQGTKEWHEHREEEKDHEDKRQHETSWRGWTTEGAGHTHTHGRVVPNLGRQARNGSEHNIKRAASSQVFKITFLAHFCFSPQNVCFLNQEKKNCQRKKEISKERNNFQLGLYAGLDVSGLKGHSCSVFGLLEPLFDDETATEVHMPKRREEKNNGEGKDETCHEIWHFSANLKINLKRKK